MSKIKSAVGKAAPKTQITERFRNIPTSLENLSGKNISFTLEKHYPKFELSFDVEQDSYCCGLFSLGNFCIDDDESDFTSKQISDLIKKGFKTLVDQYKKGKQEFTFVMTLVNNNACNYIRKAFEDEKVFTLVKSFKNLNSGNNNDLYISN